MTEYVPADLFGEDYLHFYETILFEIRVFTITELRDWLLPAGFSDVEGFAGGGEPSTIDSGRMVVVARA